MKKELGLLSPLQGEVLGAFFERERGFFLTGGGALAGFHLRHRTTTDLDLFTMDPSAFERGRHVMADLAESLAAELEILQDAPGFRRYGVSRSGETLLVDLVLERVKQLCADNPDHDGVLVDPPEEILANKLNTLVSRAEERDVVDVMLLERAGYRVENALSAALDKDGGCTPATLAWLLSQVEIPDGVSLPANVEAGELRSYIADLVRRLRRAAAPD